ncbi:hypothetical protein CCAX7_44490 [Capsulimonas corticalis]|uniref:DUF6754 domain-containing protein n=1 Tax=Capsulimonas corticalis TaxID=2219043 RepID=A0A402CX65_9BACT|nr:DUF6754 domain-containing protein [Capsulimonas corticalis]BDI32398.1 hypothetical protein CCAX7_44490 [Capsulimonas corticalis]
MQHASDNWHTGILTIVLSLIIIVRIMMAQRGMVPTIRRIAGLNAIDEAVGRATEMGRPVVMIPGVAPLGVETLQALSIFGYIARSVAKFGNRTIYPTADPMLTGIADETIRDAYAEMGRPELVEPDDIHYLTSSQFAYASGVAGILTRERAAAAFLFGLFYAESLIFAEVGQQVGAVQVAGTPSTTQIPFFIAACDYVIIGDEFYAASAYLSRNATLLGSIAGQDYGKLILLIIVFIGIICASLTAGLGAHAPVFAAKFLKFF